MPRQLLIIIPCFNEESSLPLVLDGLQQLELPPVYQLKVLVVNDGSTDRTEAVALAHRVTVLNLPINLGIGGAVQTGFKYAAENYLDLAIQLDGDGQHPPRELIKLINAYEQTGANVVIGSRFIDRKGFQSSVMRRSGISYFHWLNRLFAGVSVYDSTSGFRLFDKKALQFAADNYPDEYPEPESLVLFAKTGLTVKEVPVVMSRRLGGRSSIGKTASLYYMLKVTIAMFFSSIRKI